MPPRQAAGAVSTAPLRSIAGSVGLTVRPGRPFAPNVFAVILYCAGFIGSVAGYAWLALTTSSVTRQDVVVQWGLLDKRQLTFAYLVVVAFVIFHHAMARFVFDRRDAGRGMVGELPHRRWAARLLGAVLIAILAYCWIGVAALRDVIPGDSGALARFYDYHSHVHLGVLEQIRLGAVPYLEAQTQYGLGNLLLLYFVTDLINFSNHGFYAGALLIDVVCVVGFFVVLQQLLGLGWAIAGLVGWVLWPSPAGVLDLAGWAVLTRWLAVPILALLLAHALLNDWPRQRRWIAPMLAGAIWGAGGFLSQENVSGGLLVLMLSLVLYGPVRGLPWRSFVRFAALFVASGAAVFVVLVASSLGLSNFVEVVRQLNAQSSLVMAGVSNSAWSDDVGLSVRFDIVNGWVDESFTTHGGLRAPLQTYGFALLLMLSIGLLAGFLARRWTSASDGQRRFVWKFAGVTVGAYALHLFTLLRSDLSHLAGPSFLLPLFLLMLPLFAWQCVKPGLGRGVLLAVSVALVVEAGIVGRAELGRRVAGFGTAWRRLGRGPRRLSRLVERPGPAVRHCVPLFADTAVPGRVSQLQGLWRVGGTRWIAARAAAGTPRRAGVPRVRRPRPLSRVALFLRRIPLGFRHHREREQRLAEVRRRCLDRQGPRVRDGLRLLRLEIAVQPDVRSVEALGPRHGRHAADRRQAQLRRAVLQGLTVRREAVTPSRSSRP